MSAAIAFRREHHGQHPSQRCRRRSADSRTGAAGLPAAAHGLHRGAELFARDLQVQERLTQQTADWLQENLAPKGVGVVIEAEHLCMSLRGVRAAGAHTVTSALHGALRADDRSRQEFFALAVGAR
jgi:hypothetical protein